MSCRTNARRSAGSASRGRRAAQANSVRGSASCSGSVPSARSTTGSGRTTSSGSSRCVRRDRSMFSETRATTVVSQASRSSISRVGAAQPQPRLRTASSASLSERASGTPGAQPVLCSSIALSGRRARPSVTFLRRVISTGWTRRTRRCDASEGSHHTNLVAGASGAIGRRLVARLVDHGHEVIGTHRDPANADRVSALGAVPVELDLLDRAPCAPSSSPPRRTRSSTSDALSDITDFKHFDRSFGLTNRLRRTAPTPARRRRRGGGAPLVAQSFASPATSAPAGP